MSRTRASLLAAVAALAVLFSLLGAAPAALAATAPAATAAPTATPFTDRIKVDWVAPADGGSPILSYNVYSQTGNVTALAATVPAGTTTAVLPQSALTGTSAVLTVKAVNAVGEGGGLPTSSGLAADDWPFIRTRGDGTGELDLGRAAFTGLPQSFARFTPLDTAGDHVGLAMTRDRSRLVFGVRATPAADLDLYTLPADSSAGRTLLVGEAGVQESSPTWAPDNGAVVYTRDAGAGPALWRVPVSNGAPSGAAGAVPGGAGLTDADWSPTGGFLVARPASGTGTLVRLDPGTGTRTPIAGTSGALDLAVSPRGEAVGYLVAGPGSSVCLRLALIDRTAPVSDLGCYDVISHATASVVWDPDGTRLWAPLIGPLSAQRPNVDGVTGLLQDVQSVSPGSQPLTFTRRHRTFAPAPGLLGLTEVEAEHVSLPFAPPIRLDGTPYPTTCALDGNVTPTACSTPYTARLAPGTHSLTVQAVGGGTAVQTWASRPETRPTDRTGDGRPDLLVQDATGRIWLAPSTATGFTNRKRFAETGRTVTLLSGFTAQYPAPVPEGLARTSSFRIDSVATFTGGYSLNLVSQSWSSNTLTVAPGDWDTDGTYDLIARDTAGALWLYPGTTRGQVTGAIEYPTRRQIGSGWGGFRRILGPGDFDGDHLVDLLGLDATGGLWLYPGNGSGGTLPRRQIGTGWGGFTALVTPGDWDRDGHPDLVVRNASGQLWLYPGNGTGGFLPRRQLPGAWGAFTAIVS